MPKNFVRWLTTPWWGIRLYRGCHFPWPRIPEMVRWHHERSDGSGYPDGLLMGDVSHAGAHRWTGRHIDAMTSERPYREPLSIGGTLNEIVRMTPQKFDPDAVQALLLLMRRDAAGSSRVPFIEAEVAHHISPSDIDQLAATLQHRMSHGRLYLT